MDPNIKQELLQELDEHFSRVINFVIPSSEALFIEEIKPAFFTIRDIIIAHLSAGKVLSTISGDSNILEAFKNEVIIVFEKNPTFSKIHQDYVLLILKGLIHDIFNGNLIPRELKEDFIEKVLDGVEDFKFLYGKDGENAVREYETYLNKKVENLKRDSDVSISVNKYFENAELQQIEIINKKLLFHCLLIEELDAKLRGEWIDESSQELLLITFKDSWMNLKPNINWLKSRNSLIHLIYLLNHLGNNMSQILVSEFISKSFLLNKKKYSTGQISKSLNKFILSKNKYRSNEVKEIENIFYGIVKGLELRNIKIETNKMER